MHEVTEALKEQARTLGADLVRVAPVERWEAPPPPGVSVYPPTGYHPRELLPGARSIVVLAVGQLDGIMDAATTPARTTAPFGNFGYVHLNRILNDQVYRLARWLEARGFRSAPLGCVIGSRFRHEAETDDAIAAPLYGVFSVKRAAVLAGLGRRARNGLVASPELGTRQRLAALLTAAPLVGDPMLAGDPCPAGCAICADTCPTGAIGRDGRVDHYRCFSDAGRRGRTLAEIRREMTQHYPVDLPGVDYIPNDFASMDSAGNRLCRASCMTLCPLGERRIPDVVRRARGWAAVVPPVALEGCAPPGGPAFRAHPGAPDGDRDPALAPHALGRDWPQADSGVRVGSTSACDETIDEPSMPGLDSEALSFRAASRSVASPASTPGATSSRRGT